MVDAILPRLHEERQMMKSIKWARDGYWLTSSAALLALVLVLSPATAKAEGLHVYNVVNGALAGTFNPTLSGGDFDGLKISELSIDDIGGYRDGAAQLSLFGPSGLNAYSVVSGALQAAPFNPTLSGGEFSGLKISELAVTDIFGYRDDAAQLGLLGSAGFQAYSVVSGAAIGPVRNPTLSGGDFDGLLLSEVSFDDIVGYRDASSQLGLRGPSGFQAYSVVSGAAIGPAQNPTLSGGAFDGVVMANLPTESLAGYRDAGGSQLALFDPIPEPSSMLFYGIALAGLIPWIRRRGG